MTLPSRCHMEVLNHSDKAKTSVLATRPGLCPFPSGHDNTRSHSILLHPRIPARGPAPSREPGVTGEAASGRVRGADGMRAGEWPGRSRRDAAARGPNRAGCRVLGPRPSRRRQLRSAAVSSRIRDLDLPQSRRMSIL